MTTRRAFTLLEIIIVLALIGAMATLVLTGVARATPGIQRRDAVHALHSALLHARADAMQVGEVMQVQVAFSEEDAITIQRDDAAPVTHPAPNLARYTLRAPAGPNSVPEPFAPLIARFDTAGRTDQREWAFGLADSADTLWTIRFDPLSGAPRLIEGASGDPAAESAALIPSTERRP